MRWRGVRDDEASVCTKQGVGCEKNVYGANKLVAVRREGRGGGERGRGGEVEGYKCVCAVLIRGRDGENEVSRRGSTGGSEVSVCAKQQGMSEVGWGREEVREVCGRDRVGRRGAPSMMRVRGAERSGGAK
ncbi:hypothetical protein PMAC_000463 [Pneumocystis sp. 'macacae']|nr:hypothetical protein PMAC_000463 [Pneumocystis sp. 'macacae']